MRARKKGTSESRRRLAQTDASRPSCDAVHSLIGVFVWQRLQDQTTTSKLRRQTQTTDMDGLIMSQPDPPSDARSANRARFELELEFVQSLANPFYLHSLAQQGILNQPAFINFLKYLQYWKEKDYARLIL